MTCRCIKEYWCFYQERLECSKRGWELQQLQKLKEEDDQQLMDRDEELFTYTREDAYNMVSVYCGQIRGGVAFLLSLILCPSTGVCLWSRGWAHRDHACKSLHLMNDVWGPAFSWLSLYICFCLSFLLHSHMCICNIGMDSAYAATGWQWHIPWLGDDADVRHHAHSRVKAASCLHPQGAQEAENGPFG